MFKILFILCVVLEVIFVPIFLNYYWPGRTKKSFATKTVCSLLFCLCGVFAMKFTGNNTLYADYILWGLILGAAGDLLLHSLTKKPYPFIIGVVAFFTGHIFYIMAFQRAIYTTYPGSNLFEWYEILALCILEVIILIYAAVKNMYKTKPHLVALAVIYGGMLMAMLAKATRYVAGEIAYGTNDHMVMISVTVFLGALLFFISDLILIFILKSDVPIKRITRIVNIVTYYIAQVLLAASIFFVYSRELLAA
ncbi:MAG: hypothetical protein IJW86_00840 [Clostridia bacterium]|nr:hypothetical protein [Clostridia bacterium]